jgi:hypothetical protein
MEHGKDTSSLIRCWRCTLKETWYLCLKGGCRCPCWVPDVAKFLANLQIIMERKYRTKQKSLKLSIVFSQSRLCSVKEIYFFGFPKCFPVFLLLRIAACSRCRRNFRAFFLAIITNIKLGWENLKIQADKTNYMSKTAGDVNRGVNM